MKWANTWFKICDSFGEWKGRLVSEKGLETAHGKKIIIIGCCAAVVLGGVLYKCYNLYQDREYAMRAETAMRGGFFKEAFRNYQALAERGDPEAMRQVASMYLEGNGTAKDPEKAINYLQMAADQGDSEAMTSLGMLYFASSYAGRTCLGHDYKQAMSWFLKAGNEPNALEAIGTMYSRGLGVPVNERLAQNYFDKWINTYLEKARNGDAKAQYFMGMYLIDGQRHEINESEAVSWFEKSAAQGYVKALESLGFLYRIGGETIVPDNEKAMQYFSRLKNIYEERAQKGDASAMIYLAEMYQKGEGVPRDGALALKYYLDASDAGSIAAKENLADLAENGEFTLPNSVTPAKLRAEARSLREEKAAGGDITLMKELGFSALSAIASGESADNSDDSAQLNESINENQAEGEKASAPVSDSTASSDSSAAASLNESTVAVTDTKEEAKKPEVLDDSFNTLATNTVATGDETLVEATARGNEEAASGSDNASSQTEDSADVGQVLAFETLENSKDDGLVSVAEANVNSESKGVEAASSGDAAVAPVTATESASANGSSETKASPEVASGNEQSVDAGERVATMDTQELYKLYDEAVKWFTLASEAGDAPAMLELGRIYRDAPLPSIKNENLAVNWFEKSAAQCYEPAYLELGAVFEKQGTPLENARTAIHWFELAAMQGSTEAQMQLARLFARGGRGVQPDYISALKWLLVVKKGAELRGDTGDDDFYSEVLELEKKYSHYLTEDEVKNVHHEVEVMVEKYGTNW